MTEQVCIDSAVGRARGELAPHVPGETGVWVFIFGDLTLFSYIFGVFLHYRSDDPVLFGSASDHLDPNLGVIYTLVLLFSSLLVIRGMDRIRAGDGDGAARLFGAAFACGVVFLLLKAAEYAHEIDAGRTLTSDHFFTFYYLMTALHALHLMLGLVLFAYLIVIVRRGEPTRGKWILLEGGSCYWHMVDLLWIIIFPILYLIP